MKNSHTFTKKQQKEIARIIKKYSKLKKPYYKKITDLSQKEHEECMAV